MPNQLIIHDNKTCQIITDDDSFLSLLRKTFSYKQAGSEYSPAYQRGGWDGIVYLISKKGAFFSGLFEQVSQFMKDNNVDFEVQDLRDPVELNQPIDLSEKLSKINMSARDYQERIVDACYANRKGIVRACTGSGKSLCLALLTAKLNKPTILYVIGLDLLKQMHDLFSKLFDEPIGYLGDGVCDIQRINIATIWTIGSALKIKKKDICIDSEGYEEKFVESQSTKILQLLKQTEVHLFDECHSVVCSTIQHIYKNINPEYIFGFSGTPYRDDGTDLLINGILGEQIVNVSASELIERGILAQPIIKFKAIPPMGGLSTATYQEVYRAYITENVVRNTIIVNEVKSLLEKKYTPLVLFKQIKHGKVLFEMLKEAGVKCEMLSGTDSLKKRTEVKRMIEAKETDVIVASVVYDIGVDIPCLSALILSGSGKSQIRILQRTGRVIRGFAGKKHAAIVDFYDQIKFLKKHSMVRYEVYCSEKGFDVRPCKAMK